MAKKKKESKSNILPAVATIVISRGLDGEVSLRISRDMTHSEAAWLIEAAMELVPVEEKYVGDDEL